MKYTVGLVAMAILLTVAAVAQPSDCRRFQLGLFVQMTSWQQVGPYVPESWVLERRFTLRDDGWWTPSEYEQVDPAYKFYLFKEKRGATVANSACPPTVEIDGQLISPGGKVFRFTRAILDRTKGSLTFSTIERGGISYEGDLFFDEKPIRMGDTYRKGAATLTATTKSIGSMRTSFNFMTVNEE